MRLGSLPTSLFCYGSPQQCRSVQELPLSSGASSGPQAEMGGQGEAAGGIAGLHSGADLTPSCPTEGVQDFRNGLCSSEPGGCG